MPVNFPILFTSGKRAFLVLDPSASHLAYAIITLDFDNKEMFLVSSGMVWTKDSWTRGRRYSYMLKSIKILAEGSLDALPVGILTEAFFSNPKMMFGSSVIPTINSFAEMTADQMGLGYYELGPTSWRSILGVKPGKDAKGKRDYKEPTANLVKKSIKVPSEIPSNINRKMRQLPNDVTDVLAIALALAKHHGITKVSESHVAFYPINYLEKLAKLAEEI